MPPPPGGFVLKLGALEASGLPETESFGFGKQDPYVKLVYPNKPPVLSTVVGPMYYTAISLCALSIVG